MKKDLDRFYPKQVTYNGVSFYEVYDSREHRVIATRSDWFDALHCCFDFRDCGDLQPVQLSIPFEF